MDVTSVSNNSSEIQSLLLNQLNETGNKTNGVNNVKSQTAEYAKKGEPMYMADMDSDEDGTVTLDEFREYCKSKGINSREMIKMSQMASSYRTMKAENETIDYISKLIPNVFPKVKQTDSNSANGKQDNNNFRTSSDVNSKSAYEDYMKYCENNAETNKIKSNTKVENTGNLKITNTGKAIAAYKDSETYSLNSVYEKEV